MILMKAKLCKSFTIANEIFQWFFLNNMEYTGSLLINLKALVSCHNVKHQLGITKIWTCHSTLSSFHYNDLLFKEKCH